MSLPIENRGQIASIFMLRDSDWRKKIYTGGLLLLCIPPIGWPVALGYRKELINNLFMGTDPLLPPWEGRIWHYFIEGIKAMGVIFGYFFPLYLSLAIILYSNDVTPNINFVYYFLFFLIFPIFSTLSFPFAIFYWKFISNDFSLSWTSTITLLLLYALITFFIPAGFLQVSKSGLYRSAFDITSAAKLLCNNFPGYVRAWYDSIVMSTYGHFALPFSPWGVVWCYLGIIYAFNTIVYEENPEAYKQSWFEQLNNSGAFPLTTTNSRHFFKYIDASNSYTSLIKAGPIFIPLPAVITKLSLFKKL